MRKVRVAAVQGPPGNSLQPDRAGQSDVGSPSRTVQQNVEWTADRLRALGEFQVDIVVLAETFSIVGTGLKPETVAESVPGPLTERMAKLAREHEFAIVCPLYERRNNTLHNTAVVIDRFGEIVGRYDKIHPTGDEIENGIAPGELAATIISLDGMSVGVQICFDANWPEGWVSQKRAGA
jgi:beta-ureidopropionase